MATQAAATGVGREIPEFQGVFDTWPRGARLEAVRASAAAYKQRFERQGLVKGVRSVDLATAPYLTKYAFHGAARSPNPYLSMTNRMVTVQYEDFGGRLRTLLWEPTEPEGSAEAPFYSQLIERTGSNRLFKALERFTYKLYTTPEDALRDTGIRAEDVDYLSFDHLHVQDPRVILPHFPNAKLLVQRKEIATLEALHPMQWFWYVEGALDGIAEDRLIVLDGDVELGIGVSLVWTPGHTDGNHSLVINTEDGVWVSSENGVAIDNWQPDRLKDPRRPSLRRVAAAGGVPQREHARRLNRPVRLDGEREDTCGLRTTRSALEADPALHRACELEAPMAGGANAPARSIELRKHREQRWLTYPERLARSGRSLRSESARSRRQQALYRRSPARERRSAWRLRALECVTERPGRVTEP